MPSARPTLFALVCLLGIVGLSILRGSNHQPAPAERPRPQIESSAFAHPVSAPALASASRVHLAQKQFIMQQEAELDHLIHLKLDAWHSEPDSRAQYRLLQELCALLTDENAASVVQSLSTEDLAGHFGLAALERWLATDPTAAAIWMASRPATTDEQVSLVARTLLKDRDGFQNYLLDLPESEWKAKFLHSAASVAAASNPQQAIALAAEMNPDDAKGILQAAAFQWASDDPMAVKKWAEQSTDADLRQELIAAAAKGMAEEHPREAAAWLIASVKDPDVLAGAAQSIIRSWAAREPSATADWIALFPKGDVRNEALETVISFWSASDAAAAGAWVANLSDDSMRQAAAAILDRSKPTATK